MGFITLDNHIPQAIHALHEAVGGEVRKAALDIVKRYKETAARDTGFMASSAYVVTHTESTYGQGLSGDGPLLPELPRAENDQTAWAGVGAEYAIYPELGTRYMSAQPAFYPAVDEAMRAFAHNLDGIDHAFEKLMK